MILLPRPFWWAMLSFFNVPEDVVAMLGAIQ